MESFLSQWGLAAVFLFGFLEACCIPIPSEITFGFAGVLAGEGKLNIVAVIIVGTLAELIGSYVSYTVGRVAERPLVSRFGRYLLITERDIDRAERFLAGRGVWAVPVGRALPVVRTFISIVAGFTKMPALLFGVLSLIGTAIWVTVISLLGYSLSSTWQSISHGIAVAGYLIAAVAVLAIVALVLYRLREVRREAASAGAHAAARARSPCPARRAPRPPPPRRPPHRPRAARPPRSARNCRWSTCPRRPKPGAPRHRDPRCAAAGRAPFPLSAQRKHPATDPLGSRCAASRPKQGLRPESARPPRRSRARR
jgi:membrane protein DedA with SNARE-associated domain